MYTPPFYTVESVTSGHPDKICDQISDGILDAYLTQDPQSRVAVETFGAHGALMIGGEVTSRGDVDAKKIARAIYKGIGHTDTLDVQTRIVTQSPDIARGVDRGGAGDQGIMYGYATNETPEYLPRAVVLAHALTRGLENLRKHDSRFSQLLPDGKSQVTMNQNRITSIVISTQHSQDFSIEDVRRLIRENLILPLIEGDTEPDVFINPAGPFHVGGFTADSGLTGRKIMVDSYGGVIPHGGGAFSGKDPTKVDRSAAYMARFAAKNAVANGKAKQCFVSVSYAIGEENPLMLYATDEQGHDISQWIRKNFDFRPRAIIERLNLLRPIYYKTASYGHFGHEGLPWEAVVDYV